MGRPRDESGFGGVKVAQIAARDGRERSQGKAVPSRHWRCYFLTFSAVPTVLGSWVDRSVSYGVSDDFLCESSSNNHLSREDIHHGFAVFCCTNASRLTLMERWHPAATANEPPGRSPAARQSLPSADLAATGDRRYGTFNFTSTCATTSSLSRYLQVARRLMKVTPRSAFAAQSATPLPRNRDARESPPASPRTFS